MPQSWEQYIRELERAEGPEDDTPPTFFVCPSHGETFDGGGFCGSCYFEEIQAGERLAAEWKAAERLERGRMKGQKEGNP